MTTSLKRQVFSHPQAIVSTRNAFRIGIFPYFLLRFFSQPLSCFSPLPRKGAKNLFGTSVKSPTALESCVVTNECRILAAVHGEPSVGDRSFVVTDAAEQICASGGTGSGRESDSFPLANEERRESDVVENDLENDGQPCCSKVRLSVID